VPGAIEFSAGAPKTEREARPLPHDSQLAQSRWTETPVRDRVRFVRALRHLIAENAESLAAAAASVSDRPLAEKLVSEVLPFAEACRWLERNAARVLAPQRHGRRGRPLWLHGVDFEVQRQPFGLVLVIGPGNYPLFLPAVHALHALVGGNAVRLKPAPGTHHVALAFARLAFEAGLDPALLEILDDTNAAAREAVADGADKVIFTGSSENGRAVLAQLAKTNTPSVMELSGEDAVIVLEDADLDLVVRALRFGTQLNAGQTCIAPRRIIAVAPIADALTNRLGSARAPRAGFGALAETPTDFGAVAGVPTDLGVTADVPEGQRKLAGGDSHRISEKNAVRPGRGTGNPAPESTVPPGRIDGGGTVRWLARPANLFRPGGTNGIERQNTPPISLQVARDENHAVALANAADFALGASIFSPDIARARTLAARIKTGFVTINDLIVPTADPRMPFGGVKASGFGTTRGAEGLLEMTFPHVVAIRHGRSHPHFDDPAADDTRLFSAWLRVAHGCHRFAALADFLRALLAKLKTPNS
jgi:acyl-CoA reductase-like NAD-dependent aldehyde dehydrogenase